VGARDRENARARCALQVDREEEVDAAESDAGLDVHRLATLHTNARTDDVLQVWIKHHADGSVHTRRLYERIGARFLPALSVAGGSLRRATVEDVQAALDAMRVKDGSPVKAATVNTYVATLKSFLGFAYQVGFTRFNAAPPIKLKKARRQVAQRIMGEIEVRMLIRAANPGRDRLMLEVAYFGGLRVSELRACEEARYSRRNHPHARPKHAFPVVKL
jgi:site-specific recombinase XerD